MARDLDPKLQRIIRNATNMGDCDDMVRPTIFSRADGQTAPGDSSMAHNSQGGFKFLSTLPQSGFELDDFDRGVRRSNNPCQSVGNRDLNERFSIPARGLSGVKGQFVADNRPLYVRQSSPAQSWVGGSPPSFQLNRQLSYHPPMSGSTVFHGVQQVASQLSNNDPQTPPNPSRFTFAPTGQSIRTPSSVNELSSPSNRVSQRRRGHPSLARESDTIAQHTPANLQRPIVSAQSGDTPPVSQGIQLISPHELPDRFRQVFPYELFNAVQSKCFAPAFKAGNNMVVSAPTGSGKTVIMELAICKLVQDYGSGQFKVVYQAPTKSLCSERVRDWATKFRHLNLPCAELTGDTDVREMRAVGNAAVIVTTPEKWDSITRKWKDHIKLLQMVKLFLIDEVHILKDIRGATLEAVVSRMKSAGVSVRFIALSATVPNSQDIAVWLGKDHTNSHLPAHREVFGEEFRPVKLQKHVYGFEGNTNDFAFEKILDKKMPDLIMKHTVGKPIMVFCFTRKSCESTAAKLAEWWTALKVTERPWPRPIQRVPVCSKELGDMVSYGIAFHHAGLDTEDRAAIENAFLKGIISVICCTTTLAVGVNLPCHLVIVKNTVRYTDGGLGEYSDLEIMQILGRAGRPQFDDSAIAIIMTRMDKVERYQKMISGNDILESTLHLNLIEHLNSEISLGTVHDVHSAKIWLAGTFLSVRMRQNPGYYKFSCDTGSIDVDEKLEQICERDIELLQKSKLIADSQRLTCTEYGIAMSKYMVQFETMNLLLSIPRHAKMTQILHILAQATEFKDLRLKPNERACYREFNKSPLIKSQIKETITTYAHKVSLLIQVQLGGVDLPMNKEFSIIRRQFLSEKAICFDRAQGLIRCVVECKAYERDAVATCNALELARSISAEYWENSPMQLRQIPDIGPAAVRKLIQANIRSIRQFFDVDAAKIERVLSRNPPFGKKILDSTTSFPRLTLRAHVVKKILKCPVSVQMKARLGFLNARLPYWNRRMPCVTFIASVSNGTMAHIWRGPIKTLENGFEMVFTCDLSSVEDTVICQLACEELVGTVQTLIIEPDIPAYAFPLQALPNAEAPIPIETRQLAAETVARDGNYESLESNGSEYGGGSLFDDFVNIDTLDEIMNVEHDDEERQISASEPVQMKNGKWQCNHKCRDGQPTKNGQPCKHRCCSEGLDKPRKVQKRKALLEDDLKEPKTASSNAKQPKTVQKPSKTLPGPKLKLAEHRLCLDEVEEVDLVDDDFMTDDEDFWEVAHWEVEKAKSPGFSKTAPLLSSPGSQLDNSVWHDEDDDFPSPSAMIRDEKTTGDRAADDVELPMHSWDRQADPTGSPNAPFEHHGSFEDAVPDLVDTSDAYLSSSIRRPASPLADEPHPKRHCTVVQAVEAVEAKAARPEWVNEIDPDLVAFFEGWAEFV